MPVPKRKTSRARKGQRSSTKFIRPKAFAFCQNEACNEPIAPHIACKKCGFYKGSKVLVTKAERGQKRAEIRKVKAEQKAAEQPDQQQ